jgi:DNA (cytosine-5)-methyltransferase 1
MPLPAVTSHGAGGLVEGFIITPGGADLGVGRPVSLPLPTILTYDRFALVTPFLVNFATNANGKGRLGVSSIDRPAPTQTTRNHVYVAQPFILPQNNGNRPRSTYEPLPVITTTSRGIRIIQPYIVQASHGGGLNRRIHSVGLPLPTQPCSNRFGLVQPFFFGMGGPTFAGQPASVDMPLGTILTKNYKALALPYVIQTSNTGGNGSYVRHVDGPLYTIVTQSQLGLVQPYVVKVNHGRNPDLRGQSIDVPLQIITGKNGFGVVQPFLVKFYRDTQTQNQSVYVPLHAVTTKARFGLVVAELGEPPGDIFFRMMRSKELARAMGFENYEFTGTQEEQVKQIGNAVEVNCARALVKAILE